MELLGGPLGLVVLLVLALAVVALVVWLYRRFGMATAGTVLAVVVVLGAGAFFFRGRSYERQRFEKLALTYASETGPWKEWSGTIEPVIRGKLLVIDGDLKKLHAFHFKLPTELRPSGPEDVGTVAIQHCQKVLVGKYGKNSGYRWSCMVRLLDLKAQTSYQSQAFQGTEPAKQSFTGDQTGSPPTNALWAFISGLPRTNEAPPPAAPTADSVPMLSPI